jgi:hypothetical protein
MHRQAANYLRALGLSDRARVRELSQRIAPRPSRTIRRARLSRHVQTEPKPSLVRSKAALTMASLARIVNVAWQMFQKTSLP